MIYLNCNNQPSLICPSDHGRFFFTKDALSVWTELGQTFVVRLVMRLKNKDNHNTHYMGADVPSFVVRRSKCITKDSSSRCTMCRYTRDANYPSSSGRIICLKYKKKMLMVLPVLVFLVPAEDHSYWRNVRLGGRDTRTLVWMHREH